jgi:type II secretory pathway pseudopilin PulG
MRPAKALTLIELLLTISILAFCLCSILLTYINMFILTDLSRDLTLVNNAIQAKMEEVKKTNFDNLSSLNGTTFDLSGFSSFNAKGVIYVTDTTYTDLKRVHIEASFKSRNRVIGGDKNLNGIANAGEGFIDVGGVNELTSPAELVTLIAR